MVSVYGLVFRVCWLLVWGMGECEKLMGECSNCRVSVYGGDVSFFLCICHHHMDPDGDTIGRIYCTSPYSTVSTLHPHTCISYIIQQTLETHKFNMV